MFSNLSKFRTVLAAGFLLAMVFGFVPTTSFAGEAKDLVGRINSKFGRVAEAELDGWFTKTLVLNWKRETVNIQAGLIIRTMEGMRDRLINDGVRYFKYQNDQCGYNLIDWKTGKKTSVNERPPMC